MNRGRHKKKKSKYSYSWISRILDDNVIDKILEHQKHESKDNIVDLKVFEDCPFMSSYGNGFIWENTKEGWDYWNNIFIKVNDYKITKKL